MMKSVVYMTALFAIVSCSKDGPQVSDVPTPMVLDTPPGFPEVPVREDNPFTVESVELGRLLFNDTRLSGNNTMSCASCHIPDAAFTDGEVISPGIDGPLGFRNTPTLLNVAYQKAFFMDGGAPDLEIQALAPIHDEKEMHGDIHEAAKILRAEDRYARLSQVAYNRPLDAYVITRALANYERTLISADSRFDNWYYGGDSSALSPSEVRGWNVFNSEEANCAACHRGFDFTNGTYRNIGLYAEYEDVGRGRISLKPEDDGKFRVPTLRNITRTAPYMHDGSIETLEEVIDHFMAGGVGHPNQSMDLNVFSLTSQEKDDLIAFLGTLEGDIVGVDSYMK